MRRAANSQLQGLRLAANSELLAGEAASSGRSSAVAAAAAGSGSFAAAWQRAAGFAGARGMGAATAAFLLAASRQGSAQQHGLHHAARWRQHQLQTQLAACALSKQAMRARLRAHYSSAAAAAAAAAAAGPGSAGSWAASRVRPRWAEVQRHVRERLQWLLNREWHAREALLNSLYMQPWLGKSLLLLLAERVTRGDPRFAWCYSTPVAQSEEQLCEQPLEAAGSLGALQLLRRAAANLFRLSWLLALFAPVVLSAPLVGDYLGLSRARWLRLLRWTLERAGPAFIKWGQWAATRHDLFPPDFCDELELLHTQAPAHALPFTEAAVQQAFGFTAADLFSEFAAAPVASGSIGQIHRGLLSDTGARLTGMQPGTVVAVKVRHPGVSEAIERDFGLMMAAARVAEHLPALSALRLEESLKQFAAPLREQVDLAREATHLHAFNYNFRKIRGVSFPVPLYPLVQPGVLVETFEGGTHISAYVAKGAGAPHNSELARLGARTMLHMMLVDNLIHADLHPGNILVTLDYPFGKANVLPRLARRAAAAAGWEGATAWLDSLQRAQLVLLDAGMAMRLSPEDQRHMFGLFEAFAEMNGERLADWVLRFSGEEQSCPDPAAFRAEVASFFDRLNAETAAAPASNPKTHGAEALADVLELVRTHQVSMPGHICATVVTTMVLEGWSNKLDPHHSTLQEVKRMVAAAKGGLLGQLTEVLRRGELAADSEVMERVVLLEPALVRV